MVNKNRLKNNGCSKNNMDARVEIELSQNDLDLERGRQAKSDVVWEIHKVGTK